ncbi:M23 family metallopeptidase [Aliikangiella sp. IMCC44359]|uniref:M23 family metallopeptidase n=1 Tax=Aliikangiella sp. IMCC44359 TaxID=3459125 RepID=UPI00403B2424
MIFKRIFLVTLLLASFAVKADFVQILTPEPQQGSMIVAKLVKGDNVYFNQHKLVKSEQGIFVFGVGREAPEQVNLVIEDKGKKYSLPIKIKQRQWKIERIDGLPPTKVNPKSAAVIARIKKEASLVRQAREQLSKADYFSRSFVLPAKGRVSGVYGSQRVLNGEPKRPHYGLDIANKTGTPVVAAAAGKVTLAHKDMFYSGGTLIIDHGHGISSTYIHLNSIEVALGEQVKQGQVVGSIGATGRATGPHLDWRLNWFQTRLDPQLLIQDL